MKFSFDNETPSSSSGFTNAESTTFNSLQLELFLDSSFDKPVSTDAPAFAEQTTTRLSHVLDPSRTACLTHVDYTSRFQMPMVNRYEGPIPQQLVAYKRLTHGIPHRLGICPMFYTDDGHIEYVERHLVAVTKDLLLYDYTLSPDYSAYLDWPRPYQQVNMLKNKTIAAIWQYFGIKLIPSITWTTIDHIEEDLDGWPTKSVIAINSTGLGRDKRSRFHWHEGYEATISLLKPTHILRYGAKQPDELEHISTYYENNNRSYRKCE